MPKHDFQQLTWNPQLEDDCRQLVRLAVREDLDRQADWTTLATVTEAALGRATMVARQPGVIAGLVTAPIVIDEMDIEAEWVTKVEDGARVSAGEPLAHFSGRARDLLTAERLLLNFICHLSGIATLTASYVAAVQGTAARIYDTRKTTPGWRRLEKYAVQCGGGSNHRSGLYDAVLIKDNHRQYHQQQSASDSTPADLVTQARDFLRESKASDGPTLLEIEVDDLQQLEQVLSASPDIVMLDNMTTDQLSAAVAQRNATAPETELEASGGISLELVRAVAETGVERISVGALTHSAPSLDVALDWN
jgi:nicotinate-nucleotide pyrophosphorylase (carboxylating)